MMVDLCSGDSLDNLSTSSTNKSNNAPTCRMTSHLLETPSQVKLPAPLQLGGLAHSPPEYLTHGWPHPISKHSFQGCISSVRVNGEVSFVHCLVFLSYKTF